MRKTIFFLLLTALLLLTGCSERVHTPRILPEWGRAGRIGTASRSTPVGLCVSPGGKRILLAWPARPEGTTEDRVHLTGLDANGEIFIDQNLEPPIANLDTVQLLGDDRGRLWLFWKAGSPDAPTLWYAPLPNIDSLETLSNLALDATAVSPTGVAVTWHKVLALASGDSLVVWLDGGGNVRAQWLGRGASTVLLSNVVGADAQTTNDGDVYLTWATQIAPTQANIYSAQIEAAALTVSRPSLVAEAFLPPYTSMRALEGPVISLDHNYAYVSWVQRESSSVQVIKRLHVVTFPLDAPSAAVEMRPLTREATFPPAVAPATGAYAYRHLAQPALAHNSQFNVYNAPATRNGQRAETILALPVQYATRTRQAYQPTLVFLKNGALRGYQALTWTADASVNPAVATDAAGHLYVAWTESMGEAFHYPVYLASTAPALRVSWQRMTLADYAVIAWDYTNRIVSGVVLFPFVVMWFFFPLLWLLVRLSRGGDVYGTTGQRIQLAALWIYWASKYVLTSQLLTYIPRLHYVSPTTGSALIFIAPVGILAASVIAAGFFTIRRTARTRSLMRSFLTTVVIDAALSLCVYAVGYYE